MRLSEEGRAAGEPGAASLVGRAAAAAVFAFNIKEATLRRMRAGKSFAPRSMTRSARTIRKSDSHMDQLIV